MGAAVTEDSMRNFVLQSYHRFGQAFISDVYQEDIRMGERRSIVPAAYIIPSGIGNVTQTPTGTPADVPADVLVMAGKRAIEPPAGGHMQQMMEQAAPEYERLQRAVDK